MSTNKLHSDEVNINNKIVRQLLTQQFPEFTHLKLESVYPEGTDNKLYKLGDDKVIRMPRMERSAINIKKESQWLSQLVPLLPIAIPEPLAQGQPSINYPFPWLICQWLEGRNPDKENELNYDQAAVDLGNFIVSMQKINFPDAPACSRGQPLSTRDQETRKSIKLLDNTFNIGLLTKIWESLLTTPKWQGRPTWIHGDLHPGNLLSQSGRITAVVDFGSVGVGDPACDLMAAWTLLTTETRENFRTIIQADDPTWRRGCGWALHFGIVAYPYYKDTNPTLADIAKRTLSEVLVDYEHSKLDRLT